MTSSPSHVVFGTGPVGLATIDALRRRGESVRAVDRFTAADLPDDVEVVRGDARDRDFTAAVSVGARVVYQTLGLPYHQWVNSFPATTATMRRLAPASGIPALGPVSGGPDSAGEAPGCPG